MKAYCFSSLYSSMAPPGGNSKPLIIQPLKANTSSADPAQAALILLLAGKVSKGSKDQNKALFNGIVKQMTNGVNASEILRSIIKPQQHEDLIQAAINAAAFTEEKGQPEPQPKSDKCPLLTELLYKSFQARLAKEQRMKALKEQQESSQTSKAANAASTASALALTATQMVVNASQQQAVASEAAALASGFLPTAASAASEAAMLQPQLSSYPLLYYSQMMAAASPTASMWPQYPAATLIPTQPATSHPQNLMIPGMMQLNGVQGVKRAAPPVMYANMEKRMKLA